MQTCTPKQLALLKVMRDFEKERGFAATCEELATIIGRSKVTVFEQLTALEKKGMLLLGEPNTSRRYHAKPESPTITLEDALAAVDSVVAHGTVNRAIKDALTKAAGDKPCG